MTGLFPSESVLREQRLLAHRQALKTDKRYASLFWKLAAAKQEKSRVDRLREIWSAIINCKKG